MEAELTSGRSMLHVILKLDDGRSPKEEDYAREKNSDIIGGTYSTLIIHCPYYSMNWTNSVQNGVHITAQVCTLSLISNTGCLV